MALIRSLKDGEEIEITVIEELPEFNNDVTDHPLEDGFSITDHAALRPGELPLSGVVAGDGAADRLATLRRWRQERHLLRYTGRNILANYVVAELRTEHDVTVRDGFRFRLILKEVRTVKPAVVELVKDDPAPAPVARVAGVQATATQVKATEDKGRQQASPVPTLGDITPALNLIREGRPVFGPPEAPETPQLSTPALTTIRNAGRYYYDGHPALGG